ncbi:MAG: cytochrome o ubiquinol oxidase subunit I, partial [Candidatus Saccharimonadales bacterium]
ATPSPAPHYNFAITPRVQARDAFWEMKQNPPAQNAHLEYVDIHMPKNSGMGIIIAAFVLIFGFAVIWHIWWLAIVGLLGAISCVIIRTSDDHTEYVITAEELRKHDAKNPHRKLFA